MHHSTSSAAAFTRSVENVQPVAVADAGLPRTATPSAALGLPCLSLCHISPSRIKAPHKAPWVYASKGGRVLRVRGVSDDLNGRVLPSDRDRPGIVEKAAPMRSAIGGFSSRSRSRFSEQLAAVNTDRLAEYRYFGTLSYPAQFPACPKAWKRDLDTMCKRFFRSEFGVQFIVWKLEPQERGAPHFHLIVASHAAIPRQWFASAWHEVVGCKNHPEHYRVHVHPHQWAELRSWKGALSYAAKYLGKVSDMENLPEFWQGVGRWWGVRGKLPVEWLVGPVSGPEFVKLRRTMRKRLESATGRKVRTYGGNGLAVRLRWEDIERLIAWVFAECETECLRE